MTREYAVTASWGCLGLVAGSVIVTGWIALHILSAAAAVVMEVVTHAP